MGSLLHYFIHAAVFDLNPSKLTCFIVCFSFWQAHWVHWPVERFFYKKKYLLFLFFISLRFSLCYWIDYGWIESHPHKNYMNLLESTIPAIYTHTYMHLCTQKEHMSSQVNSKNWSYSSILIFIQAKIKRNMYVCMHPHKIYFQENWELLLLYVKIQKLNKMIS